MNETNAVERFTGLRKFKPYPAYKDSGIKWLGDIPVHWEVYSLRRKLFRQAGSIKIGPFGSQLKLDSMTQEGVKVYGQEHVIARDFGRGSKYIDQAKFRELSACEIRPHDLVITMMGSSGRCAVVPEDIEQGIMDSHLLRIRLPDADLDPRFLCLLIDESDYVKDQIGASGKGAIMHGLNSSIIKSIELAVPPTHEQRTILGFLKRETAKIDALVTKKERLIELLHEKRAALITRAVTKGLDPNVPMKDTGVQWLGEIPTHWESTKMWQISTATSGGTPTKENLSYWGGEIPWVSPKDMKRRFINSTEDTVTEHALAESGIKLIAPPVVLIVVRGMILAHSFPVAVTTAPVTINQDMKALRFMPEVDPLFMAWVLEGIGEQLVAAVVEEAAHGTRAIRMDQWRTVNVAVPPEQEQRAITAFVDRETQKIDGLIARIRTAINRLTELRTALISAAVTGKIDVREDAA